MEGDRDFVLKPSQIGQHWWFHPSRKANDMPKYPLDPSTVKGRGRPKGAKGKGKTHTIVEVEFKIDGRDLILEEHTRGAGSTPSSTTLAKAAPKPASKRSKVAPGNA